MSLDKIKYAARVLLLLYIGYFGCVSYFVHKHVYEGVVYIHSHPYKKSKADNEKEPPFETHKHTAAGFFTLNQLSNYTSFEAEALNILERLDNLLVVQLINTRVDIAEITHRVLFRHRAPPII